MSLASLPNGYLPHSFHNSGVSAVSTSAADADDGPAAMIEDPQFDILDWHSAYQSCQRYFLDHAQHSNTVQAVAALINIRLPFQWIVNPLLSTSGHSPHVTGPGAYPLHWACHNPLSPADCAGVTCWVSLVPYIRRLVVTGFDREGVLHGFFGNDWRKGIEPVQECERRNYLFAAKSVGWAKVKYQYDMTPYESVPYLEPLQDVRIEEIESAEKIWSQWLAMEDWMVGPRAPETMR